MCSRSQKDVAVAKPITLVISTCQVHYRVWKRKKGRWTKSSDILVRRGYQPRGLVKSKVYLHAAFACCRCWLALEGLQDAKRRIVRAALYDFAGQCNETQKQHVQWSEHLFDQAAPREVQVPALRGVSRARVVLSFSVQVAHNLRIRMCGADVLGTLELKACQ